MNLVSWILLKIWNQSVEPERTMPYYCSSISPDTNYESMWRLIFPYGFVRNLTLKCISNYIDTCKINKRNPYENVKDYITWFE